MTDKNNIDYRRLFFKFLKENNLYDKWVYNIKNQHSSIFKYQFFWKNKIKFYFQVIAVQLLILHFVGVIQMKVMTFGKDLK